MPSVDLAALQAEDALDEGRRDIPWRFGQPIHVALGLDDSGLWEYLPGGDGVWRLGIEAPPNVHVLRTELEQGPLQRLARPGAS
jgi:hypothetical protein